MPQIIVHADDIIGVIHEIEADNYFGGVSHQYIEDQKNQ